jgi:membrane-associated phospholipid phosphatase
MVEVGMRLAVFWPADKVIFVYSAFMCAIELIWFRQIPDAGWLLALHAIGIVLIVLAARSVFQSPSTGPIWTFRPVWTFRHWYPLLYVACCYREMAMIIAGIRHDHADLALAAIDHAFWGVYPTVWLERLYSPAFTEFLQIIYTLFLPVALLVPFVIWLQKRYVEFRYMAFLLSLGFLVSYLGYLLVPAHGPRFLLADVQHLPLRGLWLFNSMQATLNRLEQDHYDCFPSGHTELTILACWLSRSISKRLFWVYFLYTLCIVFATVYLRYHYTVDLLAGVMVALVLILAAPALYRVLSEKGESIGD